MRTYFIRGKQDSILAYGFHHETGKQGSILGTETGVTGVSVCLLWSHLIFLYLKFFKTEIPVMGVPWWFKYGNACENAS